MKRSNSLAHQRILGVTLVEIVMSMAMLALMISSIYALNTQCVSVMRSKRNLAAASLLLQERVEGFRMGDWASVTTSVGVNQLMASQTNSLTFGFMGIDDPVEKVTITTFDPSTGEVSGSPIVATRTGNVLSVTGNTNVSSATAVRLDFEFSWKELGRQVSPRKISTTLGSFGFTRTSISRKPYLPKAPNT